MKKIIMFGMVCLLAACTHAIKPENNSDKLIQVKSAPAGCVYLYKLDAEASVYSHDDAISYLKNRIAEQAKTGNVFVLERDETVQNTWVMFGPEYKYLMTARVYDCANL